MCYLPFDLSNVKYNITICSKFTRVLSKQLQLWFTANIYFKICYPYCYCMFKEKTFWWICVRCVQMQHFPSLQKMHVWNFTDANSRCHHFCFCFIHVLQLWKCNTLKLLTYFMNVPYVYPISLIISKDFCMQFLNHFQCSVNLSLWRPNTVASTLVQSPNLVCVYWLQSAVSIFR